MSQETVAERKEQKVAKAQSDDTEETISEEPKHPIQKLMDNVWLLFALGLVIPILSYTVWGWIELMMVPPAQLP